MARLNPSGMNLTDLLIIGGLGFLVYKMGWLKSIGPTPTPSPGPGGGTPVVPGGKPTDAQIQAWASGIGLPFCIGQLFVRDKGQLPANLPELENWGNSTGHRKADGSWVC